MAFYSKVIAYHHGIDITSFKTHTKSCISKIPSLYLFRLGKVKDLKTSLNVPAHTYPKDYIILKYGLTNDLKRRAMEHKRSYGKFANELALQYYVFVHPQHLYEAESNLTVYFKNKGLHLLHEHYKELVIMPEKTIHNEVLNKYKELGDAFKLF